MMINHHTHRERNMGDIKMPKAPKVTVGKNGFEIRSDVLKMAADSINTEYNFKIQQFEMKAHRDKDGYIVTSVQYPEVPGMDAIMTAAQQMYDFVTSGIPTVK